MDDRGAVRASIIVPTFREAENLTPLTERLFAAIRDAGVQAELIIVDDDSRDGSEEIAARLAAKHPVRMIVRRGERGLSGAVLHGFEHAVGDIFLVMDADLQHPPETAPELIRRLEAGDCDFVLATRYAGGSIPQEWPWTRRLISRVATALARPLAPLSDPMSGFFALRRETWARAKDRLNPLGYKIGIELFVKGGCRNPAEVPISFGLRHAGQSKFNLREQWWYIRHMFRLYRYKFPVIFWIVVFGAAAGVVAGVVTLLG